MSGHPARGDGRVEEYHYSIWLADSFEEVLDRRGFDSRTVEIGEFAEVIRRVPCTLLQARGGAGKTHTARRLCDALRERSVWSVIVPAVVLVGGEPIATWGPGQWARAANDAVAVASADQGLAGLVVIDGLNEVDRPTGERILAAIGPLTATNPQVSCLVTDRLTRRPTASPFWKHASLGPVPDDVIRTVAGTEPTEVLSIPFYLERHASGGAAQEILAESISRFVSADQLGSLAAAAYASYKKHNRRTIDRDVVSESVGTEVWQQMLEARAVLPVTRVDSLGEVTLDFQFEHHLLHDFLAAQHLAANHELWDAAGFDVVTLKAASFDPLALALPQVHPDSAVEHLVERVYDWNFYAAAYVLEEDRSGDRRIGAALELALLGALAEKRFDGIVPTVQRVEDALRVQQSPVADELLAAGDRDEVVSVVLRHAPYTRSDWFADWLDQFRRADGFPGSVQDVQAIASDHPMVGWGAANALRRASLVSEVQSRLRDLATEHESSTVRWRSVHALGPHASEENLQSLRQVLEREPATSWVAYGALRAEFEQIRQRPEDARATLLAAMTTELAEPLGTAGPLRTEAIRCLDVDPLPGNWHRDIEPLLVYLWDTADARGATELAALAERLRTRKEAVTSAH